MRNLRFAAAAAVLVAAGSVQGQSNLANDPGASIIKDSGAYPQLTNFPSANVIDNQTVDDPELGTTVTDVFGDNSAGSSSYFLTPDGGGAGAFFTLDLGLVATIEQFRVANTRNTNFGDRGTLNFDIRAANSVDGSNDLVGAVTLVDDQAIAQPTDPNTIPFLVLDPTGADFGNFRFVQFVINSAVQNAGGLNEFQVIGTAVPEPAALSLLGLGGLGLLARRRRAERTS